MIEKQMTKKEYISRNKQSSEVPGDYNCVRLIDSLTIEVN